MTTSTSLSFFSRDAILQRQARTLRSRRLHAEGKGKLNIILEEDESSRSSSPVSQHSPTSSTGIKARRRHANIADIRIAREIASHDDEDLSPLHDLLLQPSRPAPSPPTSSTSSPDSFSLTFTDIASKFPDPPRRDCASPTGSVSSLCSSPRSQHGGMPLTPVTSDDESSPSFTRRPVQPLVIAKHNPRPSSPFDEISLSPSLLQPYKNSSEMLPGAPSPVDSFFMCDAPDSDDESDSEFYNRQFSKMLSLCSPSLQRRPSVRRASKTAPEFAAARRDSAIFPAEHFEQPAKRASRSRSVVIPKYPPPPPPASSLRRHSSVSSNTSSFKSVPSPLCNKTISQNVNRPPPRSSVPADCDFEVDIDDDDESAFSFSMYAIDLDRGLEVEPESPGSVYSQPSFEVDDQEQEVTFDMDYTLMLPLSLPSSPIDLEADIAMGLEKLRNEEEESGLETAQFILEEEKKPVAKPIPAKKSAPAPLAFDDVFSPSASAFSFSPPPSAAPSSISSFSYPSPASSPAPFNEERVLKSKWSSSTLGSVREEHERKGASSKLRNYFSGTPSPLLKRSSASSKKVPATPTSPFSAFMSPKKSSRYPTSPSPSPSRGHKHTASSQSTQSQSEVMVIGYGNPFPHGATGVRRRGSVNTISDAGSDVSFSSTSSSGLRRKPIPVEMFLRA
ncbi:hypothetical protein CPC08DRAFT_822895 [Agrocybe pediades]|nr:hypothetical protein CPC08DRAFT_822895 [Agrocybe pediades]